MNLHYLAGIIDGEGYVQIAKYKTKSYHPRVTVGSVTKLLVQALQEAFGGKVNNYKSRNPRHRPFFVWQIGGVAAVNLLARIEPYLLVKKTQAQIVLSVPRFRGHKPGTRWSAEDIQLAAAMKEDLHECNRRGVKEI